MPPKGASKTQNGRFPSKIALRLKKVCYQVSMCEKCQRQSCKAFIGLTIRAVRKWLVGATPSTWNFGSNWPRWSEIADFLSLFARSGSAVTPSEKKVQLILTRSPLRAFQWAQDEHRTLSISSPKWGSKTQNCRFPSKIALRLKKVCYKVSLCENCQRQSCRTFI